MVPRNISSKSEVPRHLRSGLCFQSSTASIPLSIAISNQFPISIHFYAFFTLILVLYINTLLCFEHFNLLAPMAAQRFANVQHASKLKIPRVTNVRDNA